MLAAASSLFSRSAIYTNYTISSAASTSTSFQSSAAPAAGPTVPPFQVGLWKVTEATHKGTHKRVSVWVHDKRGAEVDKLPAVEKDRVLAVLKAEVTALSRLRHPSVLEVVEPLEDSRSELVFATEPLLSSLSLCIPDSSSRQKPQVELDEVEASLCRSLIQKGILQLAKGLSFLHTSARLIHSNLTPSSVLINSAGDWKISGLGLTIPLLSASGEPTRWEFPTYDNRLPGYTQRSFDYMAPEYAIDEKVETASDMYSLGCLVYAVHMKGRTPFSNHGSMNTLRENARKLENGTLGALPSLGSLDADLRSLLVGLITRTSSSRPTASTIPSHSFFNALAISTLNFLDRTTFAAKPREEKIAFMKGLAGVLGSFSDNLKRRKILPSLLEEMRDPLLLPSILPNVFTIANKLTPVEFASTVLPALKPLFVVRDPPQNVLAMLDNLTLIQGKTTPAVFRADVLPLVYNALDSEHANVQERALKCVPDLCETIDYAEVQGVLFPRVALVFTKTRILSVKVNTLVCFLSMVKTLDQSSLTQKLVPLLAKIRTKEPSVMMATLDVHEKMGMKVDREAVATLVLPQLWAMSVGPLLNITQFQRFMTVIRALSERIEKEHAQHLRDSQRVEDRSAISPNGSANVTSPTAVDFHSLVGGGRSPSTGPGAVTPIANGSTTPTPAPANGWDDDLWGSILGPTPASPPPSTVSARSSLSVPHGSQSTSTQSLPVTPRPISAAARALGAKPVSSALPPPISSVIPPPPSNSISSPVSNNSFSSPMSNNSFPPPVSTSNAFSSFPPPMGRSASSQPTFNASTPNYNIALTPTPPRPNNPTFTPLTPTSSGPNYSINMPSAPGTTMGVMQPQMSSGVLQPTTASSTPWSNQNIKKMGSDAWGDFDPLG
ncbi:SCY1-like protein 2 [Ceratobasidium sp. AG-Ba]|nr:SCY1-like protein 2 [Ceratobasidium sp. AG-Ba]